MASDRIVTAQHVLHATLRIERGGADAVLKKLEQLEPDLAEFVMEQTCNVFHRLLRLGLPNKTARSLHRRTKLIALVMFLAMRQAHHDLWNATGPVDPTDGDPPGPDPSAP